MAFRKTLIVTTIIAVVGYIPTMSLWWFAPVLIAFIAHCVESPTYTVYKHKDYLSKPLDSEIPTPVKIAFTKDIFRG